MGLPTAGRNGHPGRLQTEPRPDQIALRRFSWKLLGAHPAEVRRALLESAAALDRSRAAHAQALLDCRALERSLGEASTTIQELQRHLTAAKAELIIMETAGTAALEVLRSARATAQAIRRSVDAVSSRRRAGWR
jgi:hypothetical protein